MGKGAFVQIKKYGGSGGTRHMAHNLRKKTQRELRGEIKKIGDWDSVMRHINEIKPIRKSQKWDYMEIVTYPENEGQAIAVMEYLKGITNRPVAGVWHYDESHPHVHFVIAWRDENGRALRLQKGMLHTIKKDIARAVGRELTPRGQGRRTIPMHVYMTAPDHYNAIAKLEEQRIREARESIEHVLNVYRSIRVSLLNRRVGRIEWKGRIEIQYNELSNRDVVMFVPDDPKQKPYPLPVRKLYERNTQGRDEITFRPAEFIKVWDMYSKKLGKWVKTVSINMFIDDLKKEDLKRLPRGFDKPIRMMEKYELYGKACSKPMIVETSPENYQAHFVMTVNVPDYWDQKDIEKYAKRLFKSVVYYYHGDIGSADPYHLRKLPGFDNTKYDKEPPRVRLLSKEEMKEVGREFDMYDFMTYIKKSISVDREIRKHMAKNRVYPAKQKVRGQKKWIDFYREYAEKVGSEERVDLSRVDMSYAVYLAAHGFSFNDIAIALEAESKDIAFRKSGHLVDYLKRTVEKAFGYVSQSIEESIHRAMAEEQEMDNSRGPEIGD